MQHVMAIVTGVVFVLCGIAFIVEGAKRVAAQRETKIDKNVFYCNEHGCSDERWPKPDPLAKITYGESVADYPVTFVRFTDNESPYAMMQFSEEEGWVAMKLENGKWSRIDPAP